MPKNTATPTFDPTAAFAAFKLPTVDVDAFAAFKLPNVNVDAWVAAQQRNVEALTAANTVATEAAQTFATRQGEIMTRAVDQYAAAVRDMMGIKDPQAGVAKQAAFAKSTVETSAADARELAEIATKAQTETFAVLNKRFVEGLDEITAISKTA